MKQGKKGSGDRRINKYRLYGVARRRILGFRVDDDLDRFGDVRGGVNIEMTDPSGVSENGNTRSLLNVANKFVGAPRNNQIDEVIVSKNLVNRVSSLNQ